MVSHLFLARQTQRLRGGDPEITIFQVRDVTNTWIGTLFLSPADCREALERLVEIAEYYQRRNSAARRSHTKTRKQDLERLGMVIGFGGVGVLHFFGIDVGSLIL